MPERIAPQLVRATPKPPAGDGWVHEFKHDGYRIIAYLERGRVRLETRVGNDATRRFAPIAVQLARLPVRSAVLDGEIAVPDEGGVTHLDLLDAALRGRGGPLAYYAFDLLYHDGWDLRRCPLLDRKAALDELLKHAPGQILFSDHLAGDGTALFAKIGELGGEGIVSKRLDAPYTPGPASTWLKTKHASIGALPGRRLCPGRPEDRGLAGGGAPSGLARGWPGGVPPPRRPQ